MDDEATESIDDEENEENKGNSWINFAIAFFVVFILVAVLYFLFRDAIPVYLNKAKVACGDNNFMLCSGIKVEKNTINANGTTKVEEIVTIYGKLKPGVSEIKTVSFGDSNVPMQDYSSGGFIYCTNQEMVRSGDSITLKFRCFADFKENEVQTMKIRAAYNAEGKTALVEEQFGIFFRS